MKRNEVVYVIIIIIIVFGFSTYIFMKYGWNTLEINLISELLGIIVTVFLIDWVNKKRKEQSEFPLKNALFSKITSHCDVILTILYGENIEHIHGIDENPDKQFIKDKDGLLESIQIGRTLFSIELLNTLLKVIEQMEGSISMSDTLPMYMIYQQKLKIASTIKRIFEILENLEMIKKAEGVMGRIEYYVDQEKEWENG